MQFVPTSVDDVFMEEHYIPSTISDYNIRTTLPTVNL